MRLDSFYQGRWSQAGAKCKNATWVKCTHAKSTESHSANSCSLETIANGRDTKCMETYLKHRIEANSTNEDTEVKRHIWKWERNETQELFHEF